RRAQGAAAAAHRHGGARGPRGSRGAGGRAQGGGGAPAGAARAARADQGPVPGHRQGQALPQDRVRPVGTVHRQGLGEDLLLQQGVAGHPVGDAQGLRQGQAACYEEGYVRNALLPLITGIPIVQRFLFQTSIT
ncbi:unnamed protein product, partial [Heterosigma akashiwo]